MFYVRFDWIRQSNKLKRVKGDLTRYLHETVISTLVAGISPVMGSNSHTEAMSSSLSITSPSMGVRDEKKLSTSNSLAVLAALMKITAPVMGASAREERSGTTESTSVSEDRRKPQTLSKKNHISIITKTK